MLLKIGVIVIVLTIIAVIVMAKFDEEICAGILIAGLIVFAIIGVIYIVKYIDVKNEQIMIAQIEMYEEENLKMLKVTDVERLKEFGLKKYGIL